MHSLVIVWDAATILDLKEMSRCILCLFFVLLLSTHTAHTSLLAFTILKADNLTAFNTVNANKVVILDL